MAAQIDPVGAAEPGVTVVVVTWRGRNHLAQCLDSLRRQTARHRLLVVDNDSDDGSATIIAGYPEAHVLRLPRNVGFAGAMAAALDHIETPYFAVLNDDADAADDWLEALLTAIDSDERIVAVTSKVLLREGGAVNNAGVGLTSSGYGFDIGLQGDPADYCAPAEVFGFCGAAAILRTRALRAIGGWADGFFLYYEDTDASWRLRLAGGSIRYEPAARVAHAHSASTDQRSSSFARYNERNRLLMLIRCAPAAVAWSQLARFPVTTASLALQSLRGTRPPGHQFTLRLRLRVMAEVLLGLPQALRARRSVPASRRARRDLWSQWAQ